MSYLLPRRLGVGVIAVCFAATVPGSGRATTGAASAGGNPVALVEALRLTAESNPIVLAARLAVRAAAGRARDAGRRPNPELSATAENLGSVRGEDLLETTVAVFQRFELGGDRSARAGAASAELAAARSEASRTALEQAAITADRFLAAWSLQQRAALLGVATEQAREAVAAADERHRAGAAPEFERVRAETYLATRELERRRAEAALVVAKRQLALQWSDSTVGVDSIVLGEPDSIPAVHVVAGPARLAGHPVLARAVAEARASEWRVRGARGARMPDLTVGAGVRRLAQPGATVFTLEVSAPLPFWNAGGGAIEAAEADREAARVTAKALEAGLTERLSAAYDEMKASWSAYRSARDAVGPGAEEALHLMQGGYRAGRLSYLDILEGQRSVLDANLLLVESLAEVWRARTNLDLLTGGPLAPTEER